MMTNAHIFNIVADRDSEFNEMVGGFRFKEETSQVAAGIVSYVFNRLAEQARDSSNLEEWEQFMTR